MRILVLLPLSLMISAQLYSQPINSKVYFINEESLIGSYSDTTHGARTDKNARLPIDRPFHLSNGTNTLDNAPIRIGSLYSPKARINGGQNRWLIYDSLVISVDLWDLTEEDIGGTIVDFEVSPLYGLTQEMSNRDRASISNGSSNLTSTPLYRMEVNSNMGTRLARVVNYDFAIINHDLIFLLMVDSDTLEVWKCTDPILWQPQTDVQQKMFPYYTEWAMIKQYKFESGRDGFMAMNLDETRIVLIDSMNEQFLLDLEDESDLARSDANMLSHLKYVANPNVWLVNLANEPIGSLYLENKVTPDGTPDVDYLIARILEQVKD